LTEKKKITAENLIALGTYFTIKKHDGGSIRLAVNMRIKNEKFEIPEAVKDANLGWEALMQAFPGIEQVKPRLLIMSVDIQYDAEKIKPEHWEMWSCAEPTPELIGYFEAGITSLSAQLGISEE
jgi:hypothetical protein